MPRKHFAPPEAFRSGLPSGLLDPAWWQRQERQRLLDVAREQIIHLDIEGACLGDLGHAISELVSRRKPDGSHFPEIEGIGILLSQYSAVNEIRCYCLWNVLFELRRRDGEGS